MRLENESSANGGTKRACLCALIDRYLFLTLWTFAARIYETTGGGIERSEMHWCELQEQAFFAMAVMDIALMAVLLGRAFTQRALLFPFVYANMLRSRYKSPVSAKYHQAVWATLASYFQPVMKWMPAPVHSAVGWVVKAGSSSCACPPLADY